MKPSRVETVLSHTLTTRWPTFLWGPPGVGKSSIVRKIAGDRGLHLLDVRASLLDPTDLRGLPYVADDRARWSPPSFLPHDPDSQGLLFFDELNAAPPLVQASLYQLTLDRRVGEYELPAGWSIVAAGNRAEDGSVTYRMPAALANRFIHLEFEVHF
jgi:MoxR-like ATPase